MWKCDECVNVPMPRRVDGTQIFMVVMIRYDSLRPSLLALPALCDSKGYSSCYIFMGTKALLRAHPLFCLFQLRQSKAFAFTRHNRTDNIGHFFYRFLIAYNGHFFPFG